MFIHKMLLISFFRKFVEDVEEMILASGHQLVPSSSQYPDALCLHALEDPIHPIRVIQNTREFVIKLLRTPFFSGKKEFLKTWEKFIMYFIRQNGLHCITCTEDVQQELYTWVTVNAYAES